MITTALLIVGVFLTAIMVVFLVLAWRYTIRKVKATESILRAFLTAPNDKTPSPLAQLTDEMSQVVARAIISQAKTTFMGEASAVSRQANKAQNEAIQARFPWLAAISAVAPGFSKSLLKNPALLDLGQSLLNKGNTGNGKKPDAGVSSNNPPRFDL